MNARSLGSQRGSKKKPKKARTAAHSVRRAATVKTAPRPGRVKAKPAKAKKAPRATRKPAPADAHPHLHLLAPAEKVALDAIVQQIYREAERALAAHEHGMEQRAASKEDELLAAYAEARRYLVRRLTEWEREQRQAQQDDAGKPRP